MSFFKKHRKSHLPFVNNVVKHNVENFNPIKIPAYATGTKDLVDANPIKLHGDPRGHESIMYGYGKGIPVRHNPESVKNNRLLEDVNNLDSSNYYKFTK